MTDLVDAGGIFEENEAEASGPAGVGVHLDGAVWHLAELAEVILQVFFTRVPAEAAHEHFTADTEWNIMPFLSYLFGTVIAHVDTEDRFVL